MAKKNKIVFKESPAPAYVEPWRPLFPCGSCGAAFGTAPEFVEHLHNGTCEKQKKSTCAACGR